MSQVEISLLLRGTEARRLQMKQHIPVLKMVSHMTMEIQNPAPISIKMVEKLEG